MEKILMETIQTSRLLHIDDVEPLNDVDYGVLKELGEVLRKHGRTGRFGICLLHKHFDLAEDEQLFETTDEEKRVSTITVQKAAPNDNRTIETLWRFSDGPLAITKCVLTCHYDRGHKRVHVKQGF